MGRKRRRILPPKRLRLKVSFPIVQRFLNMIKLEPCPTTLFDECWVWQGATEKEGYPRFKVEGKSLPAHRYSYVTFIGPLPDYFHVDHKCENRSCVNPNHLTKREYKGHLRASAQKARPRPEKPDDDIPF